MTGQPGRHTSWTPPERARKAACDLFEGLIPDLKELANGYRVNVEVLDAEIYTMFCAHVRELLEGLATALAAADVTATRGYAHSFEGMGGTMGFPEVSAAGVALSRSAQLGDWQVCRDLYERLGQWLHVAEAANLTGDLHNE